MREAPGGQGRAGDGHYLLSMQDPERGGVNAFATPGVTYTIVHDGRHLSYRYENGLMYCTGTGKRVEPYRPWLWAEWDRKRKEKNEFIPICNIGC